MTEEGLRKETAATYSNVRSSVKGNDKLLFLMSVL